MERCKVYYKGEGGGFPQVRAVVSLVCPCCPWLVLAPKVLQLRINHLVWVLCRPMWVSEACQLFPVPSWSSSTPLYPSKWYELGSVPRLLLLPLFSTWIHIWVFQGVRSALPWMAKPICFPHLYQHQGLFFPLFQALRVWNTMFHDLYHIKKSLQSLHSTLILSIKLLSPHIFFS